MLTRRCKWWSSKKKLLVVAGAAAMPPEPGYEKFTPALGAFVKVCDFPDVGFGLQDTTVGSSMMMRLAECLVFRST
jgi:hypothetical protein